MRLEHDPDKGCDGCPFQGADHGWTGAVFRCNLSAQTTRHNHCVELDDPDVPAPPDCPIRKGPVVVASGQPAQVSSRMGFEVLAHGPNGERSTWQDGAYYLIECKHRIMERAIEALVAEGHPPEGCIVRYGGGESTLIDSCGKERFRVAIEWRQFQASIRSKWLDDE